MPEFGYRRRLLGHSFEKVFNRQVEEAVPELPDVFPAGLFQVIVDSRSQAAILGKSLQESRLARRQYGESLVTESDVRGSDEKPW